jgi:NDP-sugar pyrophosphorylase family protein
MNKGKAMKPSLLVLAAGMGSRYGGLKQLDQVGPNGETIIDYSVYDAIRAGFGKVVFVIRHEFEKEFKEAVGSRYEGKVEVAYAFQDLHDLPAGFSVPEGRVKPWGTGHAVRAARNVINEPFAMINGDDLYGPNGYRILGEYLQTVKDGAKASYAMCGFLLRNCLSENGSVSRGICEVDASGKLVSVVENTKIEKTAGGVVSHMEDGSDVRLTGEEVASLNLWGFTPSLFDNLESLFVDFLKAHGQKEKSEFYIPFVVDELIKAGKADVKVMTSPDTWMGITYREDKEGLMANIRQLIKDGVYPEKLF